MNIECVFKIAQKIQQRIKHIFIFLLVILLLAFLFKKTSFVDLLTTVKNVDLSFLVFAYFLNIIMLILMAYRWQVLYYISEKSSRPRFCETLSASFIGVFFNSFLPSTIGGDAFRTMHMQRNFPEEGLGKAFSIVFIDRLVGFLGMTVLGLGALLFNSKEILLPTSYTFAILLMFIFIAGILFLSISGKSQMISLGFKVKYFEKGSLAIATKVKQFSRHLKRYKSRKDLLFISLFISVLLRLVWFYGCYIVSLSLYIKIPLVAFFIIIPLIELIRMIPLTFQGIGVRESLFVLFFGYYGVNSSDAVLLAVLIYFLLSLNGFLGGILYFFQKTR